MNTYPNLFQFFGGYFHQDWSEQYSDAQAVIDDYLAVPGPEIEAAAMEIDTLLARSNDEDLSEILDSLGNSYDYGCDGYTARKWLNAIRSRLWSSQTN